MYNIGDIVKKKYEEGQKEYFIVVNVASALIMEDESDLDYSYMRVFPFQKNSMIYHLSTENTLLVAREETSDYNLLMDYIFAGRTKRGWSDTPDFMVAINKNKGVDTSIPKKKHRTKVRNNDLKVVYHLAETVDECLDLMNDLSTLHSILGDDEFLKQKNLVKSRLKSLLKREQQKR